MTAILQVGNRILTAEEVVSQLSKSEIFPKFLQEIIIDEAIEPFTCTEEEEKALCDNFYAGCSEAENQAWLDRNGLTRESVAKQLKRKAEIAKFKEAKWGKVAEKYFFEERKPQLDRIIYSVIYHQDPSVIQELYFRIVDGEKTFAEIATQYSQGIEARTKGVVGPVELGTLEASVSKLLTSHPPQTVLRTQIDKFYALFQLESLMPATFNQSMRQKIIEELFQQWLDRKVFESF